MRYFQIAIVLLLPGISFAGLLPGEKRIETTSTKQAIDIYTTFVNILQDEYMMIEENLISNDKDNFEKIRRKIYVHIFDRETRKTQLSTIESYVNYLGSGRYMNEYKALYAHLLDQEYIMYTIPQKVVYYINEKGRITYLEAFGIFKSTDDQIFDRSLLKRFSITKQKFWNPYYHKLLD